MEGFDETKSSTEEMAKYFVAHARAFQNMDGYCRPGWWDYQFSPTYLGMGGVRDTPGSPIRLKIDATIQELCLGASSPPVIRIDGEVDDWQEDYRVGTDPAGDSLGPIDFTGLAFVQDDTYLYFQITYASSPTEPSYLSLLFDMDGDGDAEWELLLNNIWTQRGDWCGRAELHSDGLRGGPIRGIADSIDAERSIEIRLARRFFGMTAPPAVFRVRMVQFDSAWRLLDQTSWFAIGGELD